MRAMLRGADMRPDCPDAVEAFVRRHQGPTWRFLRLCGCPADAADDLVQEALLAALHKRIVDRDDGAAAAWLRGAAGNLWRMHLRGNARRAACTAKAVAERAIVLCTADDDGEAWLAALRGCLQQLDGRARELLEHSYGHSAPRETIAAAMGLRPEGVKTYLRRVRDILRQCVLRRIAAEPEART